MKKNALLLVILLFSKLSFAVPGDLSISGNAAIGGLPTSSAKHTLVCFDDTNGQLGKCPTLIQGETGPQGPPGPSGSPIVYDGNDLELGTYMGTVASGTGDLYFPLGDIFTDLGYSFRVDFSIGLLSPLPLSVLYDGPSCTGNTFLDEGNSRFSMTMVRVGEVFRISDSNDSSSSNSPDTDALWFIPKNAVRSTITTRSYRTVNNTCNTSTREAIAWPLSLNNPNITGVANSLGTSLGSYPLPITVEWP